MPSAFRPALHLAPILAAGCLLAALPAQAGEMTIQVSNTYETEGDLRAAVYDNAEAFEDGGTPVAALVLRLSQPGAQVSFGPLPPGRYAVRVFQDINRNGEIDRNMLGMPREPFGFSNDAMGSMGPPSFDQAAVMVEDGTTDVPVKLHR